MQSGASAAHCMLGVAVGAVGGAERLTFDPAPQDFSLFLSRASLPGCMTQTFPTCISHSGRPLFQARKLRACDSPSRRRFRPSETPTRQNLRFRLGKARAWTRMSFKVSSSFPALPPRPQSWRCWELQFFEPAFSPARPDVMLCATSRLLAARAATALPFQPRVRGRELHFPGPPAAGAGNYISQGTPSRRLVTYWRGGSQDPACLRAGGPS